MKIQWYLNRLAVMNFSEIKHRAKTTIKNSRDSSTIKFNIPKFCVNQKLKAHFAAVAENMDIDEEILEAILQHKFMIFDEIYDYGKKINWASDRKNNKENLDENKKFWTKVAYKDYDQVGDIKYIWEINRFQHLPLLAIAYNKTGKLEYLEEIISEVKSWINQNSYKQGLNWTSSLECAYRNISWILTYYLIVDSITETSFKEQWEKYIFLQGKFINENLSLYSSGNNHLIGELLGLFATSLCFNLKDKESEIWFKFSEDRLFKEMKKQNYNDGVNKEQAFWYHTSVTDYYIFFFRILQILDLPIENKYFDLLYNMIEFIAIMKNNNFTVPNIGDRDEVMLLKLDYSRDFDYFASIIASGAILFKSSFFKSYGSKFDLRNRLLFKKEQWKVYEDIIPEKIKLQDKIYYEGGYAVLFDEENQIIFDFGNLGYEAIAGHGHADCLSFQLFKKGKPIFVDIGNYCYQGNSAWRPYFKSTRAHNTVEINDTSQSQYGGNFLWLNKAEGKLVEEKTLGDITFISATHNGYLKFGVEHIRSLYFKKNNFLVIQDSFISKKKGKKSLKWSFHVNEGNKVYELENKLIIENSTEKVNMIMSPKLPLEIFTGDELMGWESHKLYEKHPCCSIQYSAEIETSQVFYTLINLDNVYRNISIMDKNIRVGDSVEFIDIAIQEVN